MVLQWGCDAADALSLPGWIESSPEGSFLYKSFGFYEHSKIPGELGGINMKRDPRSVPIVGGKPGPIN